MDKFSLENDFYYSPIHDNTIKRGSSQERELLKYSNTTYWKIENGVEKEYKAIEFTQKFLLVPELGMTLNFHCEITPKENVTIGKANNN